MTTKKTKYTKANTISPFSESGGGRSRKLLKPDAVPGLRYSFRARNVFHGFIQNVRLRSALLAIMIGLLSGTDGTTAAIVLSALEDGKWVLYCQQSTEEKPERVLPGSTGDQMAAKLSGDGQRVAFDAIGGEVVIMTNSGTAGSWSVAGRIEGAARAAWHPANKDWVFVKYAVSRGGEDSDLYTRVAGRAAPEVLVRHTGNQDYPSVSADGMRLTYSSGVVVGPRQGAVQVFQQLWILDLHSTQARQVFLDHAENIEPAWSPSGKELAFASNRSGQFEIWVIHPDGTGLRQVTSGPGTKTWPAWSPDGKQILFTRFHEGKYGLGLISANGGDTKPYRPFSKQPEMELRDADWR